MRLPRPLEIVLLFIALLFANLPVILFIQLLPPSGPIWTLFVFLQVVPILYFFRMLSTSWLRFLFSTLILVLYITAAFIIIANIVIVPFSAFQSWFRLVEKGQGGGSVAFIFTMVLGFFSAFGGAQIFKNGIIRPLLCIAAAAAFILTVIYDFFWLEIITLSLFCLGAIIIPLFTGPRKSYSQFFAKIWTGFFVTAIALLISLPFLLAEPPQGSRFVWSALSPALKNLTLSLFPDFPLIYGTPGYGYGFSRDELGRRPVLSERAIFSIEAERGGRYYLRNLVYDIFSGNSWTRSQALSETSSDEVDAAQNRLFGPIDRKSTPGKTESGELAELWLTLQSEFFSQIPHTLDTRRIELQGLEREEEGDIQQKLSGSKEGGFVLTEPLIEGNRIGLRIDESQAPELLKEDRQRYLELPDKVDEEVRRLAERLKGGDNRRTIENIKDYLRRGYAYSLKTKGPGRQGDFLQHFLFESGTGFCVHFTTAFVVLARLNGIPARYVSGFLVYMPGDSEIGEVSGLDSHAWPEVYFSGEGWRRFEATAPMNPEYYTAMDMMYPYAEGLDQYTSRQLSAILGDRLPIPETEKQLEEEKPIRVSLMLLFGIMLGVLFLGSMLVVLIRFLIIQANAQLQLRYLAGKIAKTGQKYGIPLPERIGWIAWAEETARTLQRKGLLWSGASFRKKGFRLHIAGGSWSPDKGGATDGSAKPYGPLSILGVSRKVRPAYLFRSSELLLKHFFSSRDLKARDLKYLRAVRGRLKRI